MELANILSEWFGNPGKGTLGSWNLQDFPGEHISDDPLLNARLGNRSAPAEVSKASKYLFCFVFFFFWPFLCNYPCLSRLMLFLWIKMKPFSIFLLCCFCQFQPQSLQHHNSLVKSEVSKGRRLGSLFKNKVSLDFGLTWDQAQFSLENVWEPPKSGLISG